MTEGLRELGSYIEQKRNDCVISWGIDNNELNITVAPSNIANFVDFLRSDSRCKFSTLVDITGVDFPERAKRFDVICSKWPCRGCARRSTILAHFHGL